MNINTISLPWCLGRPRPTKENDEAKEETNIHEPFFWGRIFATWQEKNPSAIQRIFVKKMHQSHKLGRNLFSKIAIFRVWVKKNRKILKSFYYIL
jgi:hypothetical protein